MMKWTCLYGKFIKLQLFKRSSLCGIGLPWSSALKSNQRISIWWGEEKSVWNWRREKFWDVVSMAVWKPPRISTNGIFHFNYFWGERIFGDMDNRGKGTLSGFALPGTMRQSIVEKVDRKNSHVTWVIPLPTAIASLFKSVSSTHITNYRRRATLVSR